MVRASWGRSTAERLRRKAGLGELQFTEHDGLDHELGENQARTRNATNPIQEDISRWVAPNVNISFQFKWREPRDEEREGGQCSSSLSLLAKN